MEFIQNRPCLFLAYSSSFVRAQLGGFPLDLVELLNVGQRLLGNLALVVGMQVGVAAEFGKNRTLRLSTAA